MTRNEFMTYSGRIIDVIDPKPESICISDIGRALARSQRFAGHAHTPCSIAEHSVLVSRLCSPANALLGLLHDASEAFIHDVITVLKRNLPEYKPLEARWMAVIGEALNLPGLTDLPADVHHADAVALSTELRDCFLPPRQWDSKPPADPFLSCFGLDAEDAYTAFMNRWEELTA